MWALPMSVSVVLGLTAILWAGPAGGCGLFTAATIPALAQGVTEIVRLVKEETGRDLNEVPTACIIENHPKVGKTLLLCTICYDLQPGEICK